jgi:cyclopropane fatty-acyl-phospholipid synthase-like methyltransferase
MRERCMGPNPLKLCEELLSCADIPTGSVVLDLGSGAGLTSALMAREYDFVVYAADLWSNPTDNMRFFEECGLTNRQSFRSRPTRPRCPSLRDSSMPS